MLNSENVTFGGGGLERVAHLRGDRTAVERLKASPGARVIFVRQGRVLMQSGGIALANLTMDHPIIQARTDEMIILGVQKERAYFALNLDEMSDKDVHADLPPQAQFEDLRGVMAGMHALDAELAVSAKALFEWHALHQFCAACGHKSDMSMMGWQRDCPACGRRHFPRTDPVVIMLAVHGNKVLLGRSPGWQEGMYSLLAGFVEPGETLEQAARREVLEETNIKIGAVRYLASQPWPFPSSLMVGCYCEAESVDITIDPIEIEDAFWLGRDELMDVFAGVNKDILPARPGSIAHYLLKNWLADRLE